MVAQQSLTCKDYPMKILPLAAALALAMLSSPVFAQDQVTGTWRSDGDKITFEAEFCGQSGQLCATLITMEDNTVPILAPLVGQKIRVRSEQIEPSAWEVTPLVGMGLVSATVRLVAPERIEVNGCLGSDCRELAFTRISE